ncbi:S-adenosyl-L-methionine-dependent methyltransferase [Dipodascopsis tothii]|uniref:S-adenosyl-L-methionine-dependent methyltransferase n=1 Tax=Dipodascopsis tothii TaxID=44089 RepID=UPI0034CE85C7
MSDDGDRVEALNASKLGTKEYWDDFYAVEKGNFDEHSSDEGEVWFSDADAEEKMVEFVEEHTASSAEAVCGEFPFCRESTTVLDLGTGNGHLIFELRQTAGLGGRLVGVDYSEQSVAFAQQVLQKRARESDGLDDIAFVHEDFLAEQFAPSRAANGGVAYDLVVDKGTLDAIALSSETVRDGKTGVQLYPYVVRDGALKVGGVLLVTSCNFTQAELVRLVAVDGLVVWKTVDYPVFEFGGVSGQKVCTVAFKRVA